MVKITKTSKYIKYESGITMGFLIYLGDSPHTSDKRRGVFECRCGKVVTAVIKYAKNGDIKSCGCHRKEAWTNNLPNIQLHAGAGTLQYGIWKNMKARCFNPKNNSYPNYGGRGITMDDRWRYSYQNFLDDMGVRPNDKMSIDRIDVNGNYCKDNCRWATSAEQSVNTRQNVPLTFNGHTRLQFEWAKLLGVNESLLSKRLKRGWPVDLTLSTPSNYSNRLKKIK